MSEDGEVVKESEREMTIRLKDGEVVAVRIDEDDEPIGAWLLFEKR